MDDNVVAEQISLFSTGCHHGNRNVSMIEFLGLVVAMSAAKCD